MEPNYNKENGKEKEEPETDRREALAKGEALPVLGKVLENIPVEFEGIEVRPAGSFDELKKAYHLVYKEYLKINLIKPNKSEMRLSLYLALPNTTTLVAVHKNSGEIIGTLTLVEDSPIGLPMEQIYSKELEGLRGVCRHPAEATMLAIDGDATGPQGIYPLGFSKRLLLLLHLYRQGFDFLRTCRNVHDIVGCFHPRHEIMYKFIQMKPFGGLKQYPNVNDKPAVARHMDIVEAISRSSEVPVLNFFFNHPTPPRVHYAKRFEYSFEEFRELFAEQSEVIYTAEPYQVEFIKSSYTNFDWEKIFPRDPSTVISPWLDKYLRIILPPSDQGL